MFLFRCWFERDLVSPPQLKKKVWNLSSHSLCWSDEELALKKYYDCRLQHHDTSPVSAPSLLLPGEKLESGEESPKTPAVEVACDFFSKWKIVSTVAIATSFIATSNKKRRLALIVALAELHSVNISMPNIQWLTPHLDNISSFFKEATLLLQGKIPESVKKLQKDSVPSTEQPMLFSQLLEGEELQAFDTTSQATGAFVNFSKTFLENKVEYIRPIVGGVCILAAMCGFAHKLSLSFLDGMVKNLVDLAFTIRAKNTLVTEVFSSTDSVLKVVYNLFGATYFTAKEKKIQVLSERIQATYKKVQDYQEMFKIDYFKALYSNHMDEIFSEHAALSKEYLTLTQDEKSLFNFRDSLHWIHSEMLDIRKRYIDLSRTGAGKQEPVKIWFAGLSGVGKTYWTKEFIRKLEDGKLHSYPRTSSDDYWSGYAGQAITIWDDMGQYVDGKDMSEWHRYAGDDATDTIGASIEEKGRPFTSRYNICTSNIVYVKQLTTTVDVSAFNRRTDLRVIVDFPELVAHRKTGMPTPPPSWFADKKAKFYLIKNIPSQGTQSVPQLEGFDPSHPSVIKEITLDELAYRATHMQICNREKYRSHLKVMAIPGVEIPEIPFQYDPRVYDHLSDIPSVDTECPTPMQQPENVVNMRNRAAYAAWLQSVPIFSDVHSLNLKQYLVLHPGSTVEQLNAYAESIGSEPLDYQQPESCYQPIKIQSFNRASPIILCGPCGAGKTWVVRSMFMDNQLEYITPDTIQREQWIESLDPTKAWFVDDFTTSSAMCDAFRSLALMFDANQIAPWALIGTCNPRTPAWSGDIKQQLTRRSLVLNIAVKMTKLWNVLAPDASLAQRDSHFGISATRNSIADNKTWRFTNISESLLSFIDTNSSQHKIIRSETFSIPLKDAQYIICTDASYDDIATMGVPKYMNTYGKNVQVFEQINGKYEKLSFLRKVALASQFSSLIATSCARGGLDTLVKILNKESLKLDIPLAIIRFEDGAIGMTTSQGVVKAFRIDDQCNDSINITNNQVFIDGEPLREHPGNEEYTQLIKDVFTKQQESAPPVVTDVQQIKNLLVQNNRFAQFLFELVPFLSLLIKGAAVVTLLSTMDERSGLKKRRRIVGRVEEESSSDSETDERSKRVQSKRMTADQHSDQDLAGHKDKRNHLIIERARRPQTQRQPPAEHSDQGKHAKGKSSQVKTERAKRPQTQRQPANEHSDQGKSKVKAAVQTKVEAKEKEEIYDTATSVQKKKYIALETLPLDGSIVQNDIDEFGVVYSNTVVYAQEYAPGAFTVMRVPLDIQRCRWKMLDMAQFLGQYSRPTPRDTLQFEVRHFDNPSIDEFAIRNVIGSSYSTDYPYHVDFGSVFAFAFAQGLPLDVTARKVRPDIVVHYFSQLQTRMPTPCANKLNAIFPKYAKDIVKEEGMVDANLRPQVNHVAKNMCSITIDDVHTVHAILLNDRYVLTVSHVHFNKCKLHHRGKNYDVGVHYCDKDKDLAVLVLKNPIPGVKDITSFFTTSEILRQTLKIQMKYLKGALAIPEYSDDSTNMTLMMCNIEALINNSPSGDLSGTRGTYHASFGEFGISGVSLPGDCGSPLFIQNKTTHRKIVGIHRAGSTKYSICAYVTHEWITNVLTEKQECAEPYIVQKVPVEITLRESTFIEKRTGATVVGDIEKPIFMPNSTRVHRSGITLPDLDVHEPSIMSNHDPRAEGEIMSVQGVARYAHQENLAHVELCEVMDAMDEIGHELAHRIASNGKSTRVFTIEEAINVPPYLEYPTARPIDRNGAAGFPYNTRAGAKSKGDFLRFDPSSLKWSFNQQGKEINQRIEELIEDASSNISHLNPFVAYLKDEPVKLKKIYDARKTRVFFSGSTEYLLAYRMFFNSPMLRISELHRDIPVKVGTSPAMGDWHHMAHKFLAKSDFGFASDVSCYDSSVRRVFLQGVTRVYDKIGEVTFRDRNCKYTPQQLHNIRRTLHYSVEGANIIFGKRVIQLDQAMVSGCPGTATDNSLILWGLFRMVWKRLAAVHSPEHQSYECFRDAVELAVYGDDNMCTVKPGFAWFNFNTFKEQAALLGFKITDAAKTGGSVPDYLPFTSLEFLKRKFVQINGWWVGQLDKTSIGKAVAWIRDTGSYVVTKEHVPSLGGAWPVVQHMELVESNLTALCPEMSLYGEAQYNEWTTCIADQCSRVGISFIPPLWRAAALVYEYPF